MIVEWNGKMWRREGECNRCGACCLFGTPTPCPEARGNPDYTVTCGIHDRLAERDDPRVFETCKIITTACDAFPASPGDLTMPEIRNKCGYYFVETPRILVACPTHECKEYAWPEWLDRIRSLTYPCYDVLVADNSPTDDFYNRHKEEVPIIRVSGDSRPEMWLDRLCRSMAAIQERFLAGNYEFWMNVEADVVPPIDVVETLMRHGQKADWASHCYPSRTGSETLEQGIGCSLLSRRLMMDFDWKRASDSPDAELWKFVRSHPHTYKTVELWDVMRVEHRHG